MIKFSFNCFFSHLYKKGMKPSPNTLVSIYTSCIRLYIVTLSMFRHFGLFNSIASSKRQTTCYTMPQAVNRRPIYRDAYTQIHKSTYVKT